MLAALRYLYLYLLWYLCLNWRCSYCLLAGEAVWVPLAWEEPFQLALSQCLGWRMSQFLHQSPQNQFQHSGR